MKAAAKAAAAISDSSLIKNINLVDYSIENIHQIEQYLFGKSRGELIDFMRRGSNRLYAESSLIRRADVSLSENSVIFWWQTVMVCGLKMTAIMPDIR